MAQARDPSSGRFTGGGGGLRIRIGADTSGFRRAMRGALIQVEGLKAALRVAARGFTFAARGMITAARAASDAEETLNLLREGFGNLTEETLEWSRTTAAAVSRSQFELQKMAATLQAMLVPMLGSRQEAAKMSRDLSELAVDLSSFFNIAETDALDKLRAAIRGESEGISQLGVDVKAATLETSAFVKATGKSFKELSRGQRVQAIYAAIVEQTALAQGDAARTAGSFANRSRAINSALLDMQVAFGQTIAQNSLINAAMKVFADAVRGVTGAIEVNADLMDQWIQQGFNGIIGAVKLVIGGVKFFTQGLAALKVVGSGALFLLVKGIQANVAALKLLLLPLNLVLSGVALLAGQDFTPIDTAFAGVEEKLNILAESFKETAAEGLVDFERIGDTFGLVGEKLEAFRIKVVALAESIRTGTESGSANLDTLGGSIDDNKDKIKTLGEMMADASESWAESMGRAIVNGAKFEDVIKDVIKQLLVMAAIRGATTLLGAGPAGGIAGGLATGLLSSFHHGSNGPVRRQDLLRLPGMSPGEGVAVLREGETVNSGQGNGSDGGGNVTNVNITQAFPTTRAELDRQMRDIFLPSMRRVGVPA